MFRTHLHLHLPEKAFLRGTVSIECLCSDCIEYLGIVFFIERRFSEI